MSDLVDKGYTGQTVAGPAARAGVTVDVVSGPKPGYGFIVQPRRCVVKRTNGSINHYETALTANQGFHCLSQTPHCTADSTAASCSTRSSSASRKQPARTARARPVTGH